MLKQPLDLLAQRYIGRQNNMTTCALCPLSRNQGIPPFYGAGTLPELADVIFIDSLFQTNQVFDTDGKALEPDEVAAIHKKVLGDKVAIVKDLIGEKTFFFTTAVRCALSEGARFRPQFKTCFSYTSIQQYEKMNAILVLLGTQAYEAQFGVPSQTPRMYKPNEFIYVSNWKEDSLFFIKDALGK